MQLRLLPILFKRQSLFWKYLTYLRNLRLHMISSLQLTKMVAISASVRRPDSDMGLWNTWACTNGSRQSVTRQKNGNQWQERWLAPPEPAPDPPRRFPLSEWAHECNPAASSLEGPWCPESSGPHTLWFTHAGMQHVCKYFQVIRLRTLPFVWKTHFIISSVMFIYS